jgi:hypothetical protein
LLAAATEYRAFLLSLFGAPELLRDSPADASIQYGKDVVLGERQNKAHVYGIK